MTGQNSTNDGANAAKAWEEASLAPLWESPDSHRPNPPPEPTHIWHWHSVRPLVERAIDVVSPEDVERRVLVLANPNRPGKRATLNIISAALQILRPNESARPHRHSMNALRFVLEGGGAITTVNGKPCRMEEGDLVLTPGWSWHEHVHNGSEPIIWLDVLDVPLHRYLGTVEFEPGPVKTEPPAVSDEAFSAPCIVPEVVVWETDYSPVFRYAYQNAVAALSSAPRGKDGARRVRYINPLTANAALATIDSCMVQIDHGTETIPFRTSSNSICAVVEGEGESRIGDEVIAWGPKDVFTLPQGNWITHCARNGSARLFVISDRDVFAKLDLLRDEYGTEEQAYGS